MEQVVLRYRTTKELANRITSNALQQKISVNQFVDNAVIGAINATAQDDGIELEKGIEKNLETVFEEVQTKFQIPTPIESKEFENYLRNNQLIEIKKNRPDFSR